MKVINKLNKKMIRSGFKNRNRIILPNMMMPESETTTNFEGHGEYPNTIKFYLVSRT